MNHLIFDTLITGLPYAPAFLAIYMIFRIRADFDLTIDGSFTLGAAVTATGLTSGWGLTATLVLAVVAAALGGIITALLHITLRIPVILAGLVMSIGLYSVNLHVMRSPSISLGLDLPSVISWIDATNSNSDLIESAELLGIVVLVFVAFGYFLKTHLGLALRATGVNATMARSLGVNERFLVIMSLALANAFAGLSGSLVAQTQGFADVNMGNGTVIAGVGAVLLGELLLRPSPSQVVRLIAAVLAGTMMHRLILVGALRAGLPADDLKGITALTLLAAVAVQRTLGSVTTTLRRMRPPPGPSPGVGATAAAPPGRGAQVSAHSPATLAPNAGKEGTPRA